jgi:uncharacterized protein with PIN domain
MNSEEVHEMNQPEMETEDVKYFFFIQGDIPSVLMARVACRCAGRHDQRGKYERRVIYCPYCNKPLTDVEKNTKVELYRYPARKKIQCHAYPLCPVCKNEVGMILA